MKIKMRYDNTYQTLEVDAEKMWVSLSLEAGSNISQEEKEQLIQDKVEEIYNKPEYNSWHKLDRHRGEPKRTFRKDDEDADNSDGLDLIPDYSDEERRERKENYEEVCQKLRSLLKPEYADVIISVVLDGNTPEEYAAYIGVHRDTVCLFTDFSRRMAYCQLWKCTRGQPQQHYVTLRRVHYKAAREH